MRNISDSPYACLLKSSHVYVAHLHNLTKTCFKVLVYLFSLIQQRRNVIGWIYLWIKYIGILWVCFKEYCFLTPRKKESTKYSYQQNDITKRFELWISTFIHFQSIVKFNMLNRIKINPKQTLIESTINAFENYFWKTY